MQQVHRATLHDGRKVVLKIQYPGVARSIESDVDNLLRIITYANFLPKGLYVEAAAKVHNFLPKGLCVGSRGQGARCSAQLCAFAGRGQAPTSWTYAWDLRQSPALKNAAG